MLQHGCHFPVSDLEEKIRLQDLVGNIERGNHKSASKKDKILSDTILKEVKKGWCLILPEDKAHIIPDLEIQPMGVATRMGITETGDFIPKDRVTHDCSWPGKASGESINSRIEDDKLEPIMFGHCLLRMIHYIVDLRRRHPGKVIWIRKEDFKSAYRRMHLRARTAKRVAIRVFLQGSWYLLLTLRHPFGGAPGPSQFCTFSDITVDTINDLLASKEWNEDEVASDFVKHIPKPQFFDASVPFAEAKELLVDIPPADNGKCDGYIDDLISTCVNIGDNLKRIMAAPCTVIHALMHHSSTPTFIPRDDLIAMDKCIAEGAPAESHICLGWQLDSRRLKVRLPLHKYRAWDSELAAITENTTISYEPLESIIGKLENVITIYKMAGHFMNNLIALKIKGEKSRHNQRIPKRVKDDIQLQRKFLRAAHEGISMNIVTFRKPTVIILGDACEHGLGAFNLKTGRGWTLYIPKHLQGRAHINLLEFLTQVIQIWIDIIEGAIQEEDCILAMGDNTTSMGWLHRTNFRETRQEAGSYPETDHDWLVKQTVARKLATLIMNAKAMLYSQWFCGDHNVCTDSLSRDCPYLSPSSHQSFLKSCAPKQTPANLSIRPVPDEIVCFVTSMLQQLPVQQQRCRKQKASELLRGATGTLSCSPWDLNNHFTSTASQDFKGQLLSPHLRKRLDKVPSPSDLVETWLKEQSVPPSHMWHRPLGQTTGVTPDWTRMVRHASSCKSSTEVTRI